MSEEIYLVWSNEHRGWWKPGGYGYSTGLRGAGHFSRDQAIAIRKQALPTAHHVGTIAEIPVRLADLTDILRDERVPDPIVKSKNE
jgi:hypothetical protein